MTALLPGLGYLLALGTVFQVVRSSDLPAGFRLILLAAWAITTWGYTRVLRRERLAFPGVVDWTAVSGSLCAALAGGTCGFLAAGAAFLSDDSWSRLGGIGFAGAGAAIAGLLYGRITRCPETGRRIEDGKDLLIALFSLSAVSLLLAKASAALAGPMGLPPLPGGVSPWEGTLRVGPVSLLWLAGAGCLLWRNPGTMGDVPQPESGTRSRLSSEVHPPGGTPVQGGESRTGASRHAPL